MPTPTKAPKLAGLEYADVREDLATHDYRSPVWADVAQKPKKNKRWGRRRLKDIQGLVVHQSAMPGEHDRDELEAIARYHSGPNHISSTGAPGMCYTWAIDKVGNVYLCNDPQAITWSQGGGVNPFPGTKNNTNFMSVCILGDFSGPSYRGRDIEPTEAQLDALKALWRGLSRYYEMDSHMLLTHAMFGKENCPGRTLAFEVHKLRTQGLTLPRTVKQWQQGLVDLGYNLGAYGPKRDGVDGDWGGLSRTALLKFQREHRVQATGWRDDMTAVELAWALAHRSD